MEEVRDDLLWKQAKRRANFKRSVVAYFAVNTFLWALWYFTQRGGYMWPIWPTLGWGIALTFSYFGAYGGGGKDEMTRKEYEKLKRERQA